MLGMISIQKIRKIFPVSLRSKLPRTVAFVKIDPRESRRLNRRYRRKNKPANVLSFRYGPKYGEILVCPAVIRHEAKQGGVPYKYQMTKMVVHAMVHLAGIHHEKSREVAKKVEQLERRILRKLSRQVKL